MSTKDFKFELKAMSDDGTFEGYLSVFDVVDLGGDLVEKGAFSKTIKEANGGFVPMLWQHDEKKPIGKLYLSEDDYGLKVRGELALGVAQADEAYMLLKSGVVRGLSIGYKAIRKQVEKGIRHLKEVALFEGSVVTFPMLPLAQVTAVKDMGRKSDFLAELQEAQMYAMRGMIMSALRSSLDDIAYAYSEDMDAAARIAASSDSIDQFKTAYMDHLPNMFDMWGMKGQPPAEKAGRRISSSSRAAIEEAITKLQALLLDEQATSADEADAGKSIEQAPPAEQITPEPQGLHLMLKQFQFTTTGAN
jgi:HK97 family phage prohead protease